MSEIKADSGTFETTVVCNLQLVYSDAGTCQTTHNPVSAPHCELDQINVVAETGNGLEI